VLDYCESPYQIHNHGSEAVGQAPNLFLTALRRENSGLLLEFQNRIAGVHECDDEVYGFGEFEPDDSTVAVVG
jgi:hypothetical protein